MSALPGYFRHQLVSLSLARPINLDAEIPDCAFGISHCKTTRKGPLHRISRSADVLGMASIYPPLGLALTGDAAFNIAR